MSSPEFEEHITKVAALLNVGKGYATRVIESSLLMSLLELSVTGQAYSVIGKLSIEDGKISLLEESDILLEQMKKISRTEVLEKVSDGKLSHRKS